MSIIEFRVAMLVQYINIQEAGQFSLQKYLRSVFVESLNAIKTFKHKLLQIAF